jgi:hypothetical protein
MATTTETNVTTDTFTPSAEQQEQFNAIFNELAKWGAIGNKPASENMLLAGAVALVNRANDNAHQYKQYNRCMDYDTLASDIKALKTKNQDIISKMVKDTER